MNLAMPSWNSCTRGREGQVGFVDHRADRGAFEDVVEIAQQAVGDIEHGAGVC